MTYTRHPLAMRLSIGLAVLVSTGAASAQSADGSGSSTPTPRTTPESPWRWEHPRPQGNTVRGACRDASGATWIAGEVATFGRVSSDLRRFEREVVRERVDLARVACCPSGVFAVGTGGVLVHRRPDGSIRERVLGEPRRRPVLTDVACLGERGVVIASGADEAFFSEDGGSTFESRAAPEPLYALHVLSNERDSVVLAGGPRGVVARTTDLGRTWTLARSGVRGNVLAFATRGSERAAPREVIAVGAAGSAIRTRDDGATWTAIPTGTAADLFDVASTGSELVAVGASGAIVLPARAEAFEPLALERRFHALVSSRSGLLALGVGGRTAERRGRGAFRPSARLESSLFAGYADSRTRVVVGDRGVILRGGPTGELRAVRSPVVTALHAVAGNTAGVMLAVGAEGVILRSTDRGARWTRVPFERVSAEGLRAPSTFQAVWLDDAGHALAVGQQGVRARSDDGGRTWVDDSTERSDQRSGIAWHAGSLVVVGTQGRIERSDDFGVTWQTEASPAPGLDLRTPHVTPSGALIVTARPGLVARRDAAGRWSTTTLRAEVFFAGIAASGDTLLLVASDGSTFASRDEGAHWTEERRLTREVLTSVFAGPSGAWATGYWGMLLARER